MDAATQPPEAFQPPSPSEVPVLPYWLQYSRRQFHYGIIVLSRQINLSIRFTRACSSTMDIREVKQIEQSRE
jgi:hypothetical protein